LAWPCASLSFLKLSRSIMMTEVGLPVRSARLT